MVRFWSRPWRRSQLGEAGPGPLACGASAPAAAGVARVERVATQTEMPPGPPGLGCSTGSVRATLDGVGLSAAHATLDWSGTAEPTRH